MVRIAIFKVNFKVRCDLCHSFFFGSVLYCPCGCAGAPALPGPAVSRAVWGVWRGDSSWFLVRCGVLRLWLRVRGAGLRCAAALVRPLSGLLSCRLRPCGCGAVAGGAGLGLPLPSRSFRSPAWRGGCCWSARSASLRVVACSYPTPTLTRGGLSWQAPVCDCTPGLFASPPLPRSGSLG